MAAVSVETPVDTLQDAFVVIDTLMGDLTNLKTELKELKKTHESFVQHQFEFNSAFRADLITLHHEMHESKNSHQNFVGWVKQVAYVRLNVPR